VVGQKCRSTARMRYRDEDFSICRILFFTSGFRSSSLSWAAASASCNWRGDYFNPDKRVGGDVLSGYMADFRLKL
jgi:hypothetical protein